MALPTHHFFWDFAEKSPSLPRFFSRGQLCGRERATGEFFYRVVQRKLTAHSGATVTVFFFSVADNFSLFNDWNAVIGYCHRSRRVHFDFVDSILAEGYDQPKVAQARRTATPELFTQIPVFRAATLFG